MLFPKRFWTGLTDGSVTVAFRYWKRPTVKGGGTLHGPVGVLAIESVERIAARAITPAEARAAGYESRARLLADLAKFRAPGTTLYRIAFHYAGEDPRRALRQSDRLGPAELEELRSRLARLDRASSHGPWTSDVLELVRGCEFREAKPQIELGEQGRRAVISDNVFNGPARIANHSHGSVQIANNAGSELSGRCGGLRRKPAWIHSTSASLALAAKGGTT